MSPYYKLELVVPHREKTHITQTNYFCPMCCIMALKMTISLQLEETRSKTVLLQ